MVAATTGTVAEPTGLGRFRAEVRRLCGFSVPGVGHTAAVDTDAPDPARPPDPRGAVPRRAAGQNVRAWVTWFRWTRTS
ncbi:hypothetical protein [Kitasatospora sp. NPDC056184]|uniref:hypothetical protein n=1 Tax=Kitasatospora sp. NPDC056184 TaxID=3345738 RepID=UPI0035D840A4